MLIYLSCEFEGCANPDNGVASFCPLEQDSTRTYYNSNNNDGVWGDWECCIPICEICVDNYIPWYYYGEGVLIRTGKNDYSLNKQYCY